MYSVTTDEKKIVKKPKLMDTYSEQTEFSDTSSKGIEEEASGSPYRNKEIPNKSMCL